MEIKWTRERNYLQSSMHIINQEGSWKQPTQQRYMIPCGPMSTTIEDESENAFVAERYNCKLVLEYALKIRLMKGETLKVFVVVSSFEHSHYSCLYT